MYGEVPPLAAGLPPIVVDAPIHMEVLVPASAITLHWALSILQLKSITHINSENDLTPFALKSADGLNFCNTSKYVSLVFIYFV